MPRWGLAPAWLVVASGQLLGRYVCCCYVVAVAVAQVVLGMVVFVVVAAVECVIYLYIYIYIYILLLSRLSVPTKKYLKNACEIDRRSKVIIKCMRSRYPSEGVVVLRLLAGDVVCSPNLTISNVFAPTCREFIIFPIYFNDSYLHMISLILHRCSRAMNSMVCAHRDFT